MKELQALLTSQGLDPSSLRLLSGQGGGVTYGVTAPGEAALELLWRLRQVTPALGLWPVLVGGEGQEDLPARVEGRPLTAEQIVAEAEGIDFPAWIENEHDDLIARSRRELIEMERAGDEYAVLLRKLLNQPSPWQCLHREKWRTDADPSEHWEIGRALTHHDEDGLAITLALVPARHGWQALARLNFGSQWPAFRPALHVAAWRHFEQAHGVEVVAVTWDTIHAAVSRPPRSRKKALELARAQCLYCPNLETQVYMCVDALAARLLHGESWYFWWD